VEVKPRPFLRFRHCIEVSIQAHAPTAIPQKEISVLSVLGGWVSTTAGLDVVVKENSYLCREVNPGAPAAVVTTTIMMIMIINLTNSMQ
jgi:hypothetical protein